MPTGCLHHSCGEPEQGKRRDSGGVPREQIEGCSTAAKCLETKGNWCAAISTEWLFAGAEPADQIRAGAHMTLSLSNGGTKPKEGG